MSQRLSQNLVQGWVKTWSKYVAQHNWTKFWVNKIVNVVFLSSFFKLKILLSLQKEKHFWKIKKEKWTKVWLKKAFLDQVLTLQHIYIYTVPGTVWGAFLQLYTIVYSLKSPKRRLKKRTLASLPKFIVLFHPPGFLYNVCLPVSVGKQADLPC